MPVCWMTVTGTQSINRIPGEMTTVSRVKGRMSENQGGTVYAPLDIGYVQGFLYPFRRMDIY